MLICSRLIVPIVGNCRKKISTMNSSTAYRVARARRGEYFTDPVDICTVALTALYYFRWWFVTSHRLYLQQKSPRVQFAVLKR